MLGHIAQAAFCPRQHQHRPPGPQEKQRKGKVAESPQRTRSPAEGPELLLCEGDGAGRNYVGPEGDRLIILNA